ncbi:MAG: transglycosylase domain-containing protein [Salinibacter sp.]
MSEWSYSEEELDEYFSDREARRKARADEGTLSRPTSGLRGFFHQQFSEPEKAQAATALTVITGVVLIGVLGFGVYIWTLTDDIPTTERLEDPEMQLATIAYTADGKELARYARQNRSRVPYDSIATPVKQALIATEDQRFYEHWGVDPQAIMAAVVDILSGGFRGASTITQQLARNLYNKEVGRAVTIPRKIREMVTAVELERQYTKREIMRMYLNTVSFGGNVYGIESAAQTYYGCRAAELDTLQAATLIGLLKATSYYNPVRNPQNAKQRRNVVLRLMRGQGFIDASFYQAHADDPVRADYHSSRLSASLAPYFAEHVRTTLSDWTDDPSHPLHGQDIYADGLQVYTTLDSKLQSLARAAVEKQMSGLQKVVGYQWSEPSPGLYSNSLDDYRSLEPGTDYEPFAHFWESNPDLLKEFIRGTPRYETLRSRGMSKREATDRLRANGPFMDSLKTAKSRLGAGLVSLNPRNGHVKVWIGGRDFRTDKYDKVGIARRQPGSTFKPFTYTAAIDNGYSPYDTLLDSTFTWEDPGADTTWSPKNYNQESSGEMLTLSQGLANSKNTITARLALDLNPNTVATYANRMGIPRTHVDVNPDTKDKVEGVPSIALGTSNVRLLDMAAAYSTLASGGLYNEPVAITRVEDKFGNVLWEASPSPSEVLSRRTAYTVVDMMRGVIDYGTGVRIRTQFGLGEYDLAGKTGTTDRSADTWFMLMHPDLVSGAWVGFDDQRLTFRTSFWGQGAHSALFLVGDYYRRITKADDVSLSDASFPLVKGFGAPEDTTETEGGGIGW